MSINARTQAVLALEKIIRQKQSSTVVINDLDPIMLGRDYGLACEIIYGVLRWYYRYQSLLNALLDKPLRSKDIILESVLMVGFYQFDFMRVPAHAAVSTTVDIVRDVDRAWASGFVNAVLRRYQKDAALLAQALDAQIEYRYAHPSWLCKMIFQDWQGSAPAILDANNQRAPLWLRVNAQRISVEEYAQKLLAANLAHRRDADISEALCLENAISTDLLPGYNEGLVSVQDLASQTVAGLLDLAPGQTVLDACAAPGGKTAHILETCPSLARLVAVDSDAARLASVQKNLTRLHLDSNSVATQFIIADAADPASWAGDLTFDRILLDAPCSATGVIRRHPDIKLLRQAVDIEPLRVKQGRILEQLWLYLKPGGMLLYTTCSLLKAENSLQIERFVTCREDVQIVSIGQNWGVDQPYGRQRLPDENGADGFYYVKLLKK